jgi:hypothetical protein
MHWWSASRYEIHLIQIHICASGAKSSRVFEDSLSVIRAICRPLEQLAKLGLESRTTPGTYYVALELELSLYEPRAISIQSRSISGKELQSRRQRNKW